MPLLKYRCNVCGKIFDELVRTVDKAPRCPVCGEETTRFYKGKCSFGVLGAAAGGGCSGNCSHCAGCGGH
ncbi:MAG: FmdB family zinc ribbon protein [Christensenellales bacterium]|jgi:putative FmdB family regulatory protein